MRIRTMMVGSRGIGKLRVRRMRRGQGLRNLRRVVRRRERRRTARCVAFGWAGKKALVVVMLTIARDLTVKQYDDDEPSSPPSRRRRDSPDDYTDDSDDERDRHVSSSKKKSTADVIGPSDMKDMIVTRSKLAQFVAAPWFEEWVKREFRQGCDGRREHDGTKLTFVVTLQTLG